MDLFMPEKVFFEQSSLNYPLGRKLYEYFRERNVEIVKGGMAHAARSVSGMSERKRYASAKKTLVVVTKKGLSLDVCKPSADYEFSLVTNCPGSCEYCYLQTTQGFKPYLRVYVNIEDIFRTIKRYAGMNPDNITIFEAASSGDPLALEHLTGSLAKTIEFFGSLENARLRVVTKFTSIDSLLELDHKRHTRFRFSINTRYVIKNFEHNTGTFDERILAASKMAAAGYPVGFIIAPIMLYNGWKEEYKELFDRLHEKLQVNTSEPITFELIQHRFTPTARKFILERFPNTLLDMDETKRTLKWGKYGRFKYVYPKEEAQEIKEYISELIKKRFPGGKIEYFT